ncbi:hypothetical protein HYU16_00635 [Candidatus Woesearchaeota archaeon]|nr:hypothetical protein [Candidatus Woesearchaeota archaeon]
MGNEDVISAVKSKYPLSRLKEMLEGLGSVKAMVVGDTIIDEYHFTIPKGRATKDPILSVDYINHEVYAGGILAIANHVSNFVGSVTCVTLLGNKDDRKGFVEGSLNRNVTLKSFMKENSPTTVKKRYLNYLRNEKLFKVEYINDRPISEKLEAELIAFLNVELPRHDLVLVGDFGHGMITPAIIEVLEKKAKYLCVNAQSNSSNLGFNFVTRYHLPAFVTMDVQELQYAVGDRFSPMPVLIQKLHEKAGFNKFLVTMGKDGAGFFSSGRLSFFPAFVTRPQDTVGAGDAVFSIASLFSYSSHDELIPFIANCVGGIAVSYMGNKEFITRNALVSFVEEVYNGNTKVR